MYASDYAVQAKTAATSTSAKLVMVMLNFKLHTFIMLLAFPPQGKYLNISFPIDFNLGKRTAYMELLHIF